MINHREGYHECVAQLRLVDEILVQVGFFFFFPRKWFLWLPIWPCCYRNSHGIFWSRGLACQDEINSLFPLQRDVMWCDVIGQMKTREGRKEKPKLRAQKLANRGRVSSKRELKWGNSRQAIQDRMEEIWRPTSKHQDFLFFFFSFFFSSKEKHFSTTQMPTTSTLFPELPARI